MVCDRLIDEAPEGWIYLCLVRVQNHWSMIRNRGCCRLAVWGQVGYCLILQHDAWHPIKMMTSKVENGRSSRLISTETQTRIGTGTGTGTEGLEKGIINVG